jgi:hypothetical protein
MFSTSISVGVVCSVGAIVLGFGRFAPISVQHCLSAAEAAGLPICNCHPITTKSLDTHNLVAGLTKRCCKKNIILP